MGSQSPVYGVRAVPIEKIRANSWNPNAVAPPEMKLLELSILEDGYTKDELLRLKQITGLAALFQDQEFSEAWETDMHAGEPETADADGDQ